MKLGEKLGSNWNLKFGFQKFMFLKTLKTEAFSFDVFLSEQWMLEKPFFEFFSVRDLFKNQKALFRKLST